MQEQESNPSMPRIIDFLLHTASEVDYHVMDQQWQDYLSYLESIRDRLGPGAYAYASGPMHNGGSEEAPHDSWFDTLSVSATQGDRDAGTRRKVDLHLRLLGSYLNGFIDFHYVNVQSYKLVDVHEWRFDEVSLSDEGYVRHEIAFDAD